MTFGACLTKLTLDPDRSEHARAAGACPPRPTEPGPSGRPPANLGCIVARTGLTWFNHNFRSLERQMMLLNRGPASRPQPQSILGVSCPPFFVSSMRPIWTSIASSRGPRFACMLKQACAWEKKHASCFRSKFGHIFIRTQGGLCGFYSECEDKWRRVRVFNCDMPLASRVQQNGQ